MAAMAVSVGRTVGTVVVMVVVMAVATAVLAACDAGEEASDIPATSPSVETTAATSDPITTTNPPTTLAPTTSPTATTEPPTTEPPTPPSTDAPASTTLPEDVPPRVTFPDDPDKQAVVDAVYRYFDALNASQADPSDAEAKRRVLAAVSSPIRERVVEYLDRLLVEREAFVDLGAETTSIDVFADVVSIADNAALVDACVVDRTSHIEVGGGDNGADRVLDDVVVAAVLSYSLVRTGPDWRVSDLAVADRVEGREQCGDSSLQP